MRKPKPHPFLESEYSRPEPGADAILLGLGVDGEVSFRRGAAEGPSGIRAFSESIESYSPRAGRDLTELRVIDAGDGVSDDAVDQVIDAAWTVGRRPLLTFLGGDHSITPPIVRAVAERTPRLALIGFDAHMDLREDYPGDHACTYRRVAESGVPCHVLGPRSGAKSEWDDAPRVLEYLNRSLDVAYVRETLAGRPVYLTVDIDILDPSVAPGTGNPEAGGPGFDELLVAVEGLRDLDVVACDVVEVSPPLDPSGITQAAAAILVREMLLRFAKK